MAFAEVLEQELASFQSHSSVAGAGPSYPPPPPHPFLFAAQQRHFGATVYRTSHSRAGVSLNSCSNVPPAPPPLPRRPRRLLTVREERALKELVALGAPLSADFTVRELRSAFRILARQYHPDRHPGSSDAEKARLARVFADVNENHRRLTAAIERGESRS